MRIIHVNAGFRANLLSQGTFTGPVDITITNEEFAALPETAFSRVLVDLGETDDATWAQRLVAIEASQDQIEQSQDEVQNFLVTSVGLLELTQAQQAQMAEDIANFHDVADLAGQFQAKNIEQDAVLAALQAQIDEILNPPTTPGSAYPSTIRYPSSTSYPKVS